MCTRKQALEQARACIGHPHRYAGRGWVLYAPWVPGDVAGPRTTVSAPTYETARLLRARLIVREGLYLLGLPIPAVRAAEHVVWSGIETRQNLLWLAACREADRVASGLRPKSDHRDGGLEVGV